MAHSPRNFGGLEKQFCRRVQSRFLVLPIPYETTTTYGKGTGRGPEAILNASTQVELYDEELRRETHVCGIHTLPAFRSKKAPDVMCRDLSAHVRRILDGIPGLDPMRAGGLPRQVLVSLGGEHSITAGLIVPFVERWPDLSVLHIDAHADLREEYEGTRFNHACAIKRVADYCPVVQVGIRNYSVGEVPYVNRGRVRTYMAQDVDNYVRLGREIVEHLSDHVYVSIDIDGLDPSICPGTGTPEPGGLDWYETLDTLRPTCLSHRVVGLDLMEVAPIRGQHITEFTAAKLIYRMMGWITQKA